jgi:hypothetical protein
VNNRSIRLLNLFYVDGSTFTAGTNYYVYILGCSIATLILIKETNSKMKNGFPNIDLFTNMLITSHKYFDVGLYFAPLQQKRPDHSLLSLHKNSCFYLQYCIKCPTFALKEMGETQDLYAFIKLTMDMYLLS